MSLYQQVFGWLGILQGFALFGVLLLRSHYRRMPLLTLYVGGVRVFGVVYAVDPTWEKYMLLQVVSAVLRFGVALELAYCIFGAFPAAASTARRILLLILVATAVIALATAPADALDRRTHAESIPRMANAAIWMFTALAGLVLWYRLPLAPLPRAVLMGYAPYLLVFTIGISLLFDPGPPHLRAWAGYLSPLAFFILTNYWLRVAWRTAPESARPVEFPAATAVARPQPQQAS
jgi:hypothetical protein